MILLVAALAASAALLALALYRLLGNFDEARADLEQARTDHRGQVVRLVAEMASERREWAHERHDLLVNVADEQQRARQERTVLLNRIQDPAATAYASNVQAMSSAGDMSMEVTR